MYPLQGYLDLWPSRLLCRSGHRVLLWRDLSVPVSLLCCLLPAVCSWVAVARSIRHFLQCSTGQGLASVSADVSFAVSVGVSVPPTCPDEAGAVASAASTIWQLPFANLGPQPFAAPVQRLELVDPAAFVLEMATEFLNAVRVRPWFF